MPKPPGDDNGMDTPDMRSSGGSESGDAVWTDSGPAGADTWGDRPLIGAGPPVLRAKTVPASVMWRPSTEVVGRGLFWRRSARSRIRRKLAATLGTPPADALDALVGLVAEADLQAYDARRSSRWWRRTYYVFGLPAAVLAGIAGATGLASASGRVTAAVIALVSAGLSAAATFLNSDQRAARNDSLGSAWQELADDARMAVLQHDDGKASQPMVGDTLLTLHRRKSRLIRGELGQREE